MPSIPGFWDIGPHDPLDVESTWREFVSGLGGTVVEHIVPNPRTFENADFLFQSNGVVAELKEVATEFGASAAFTKGFDELMSKVVAENPNWKPALFGGNEPLPHWFQREFIRLFRPPISRILKKANRQLRDTKAHFDVDEATGILLFVNDGFTTLGPEPVRALAASLLQHSYSSIDCFVYLTVNRYIEIQDSDVPRLLWAPVYSDRAPGRLVEFVDALGSSWFSFLESKIGPFTVPNIPVQSANALQGSKPIVLPPQ
ncbi:MAG: hypothetical protein ORN83_09650 [Chthoniobacteraceae bacterium]|nr:hypothetical protein [Chthoniobacteraceae bacterium]